MTTIYTPPADLDRAIKLMFLWSDRGYMTSQPFPIRKLNTRSEMINAVLEHAKAEIWQVPVEIETTTMTEDEFRVLANEILEKE